MKTISERCGNGSPPSIVAGIASAAASETAPRIPAQPATRRAPGPRRGGSSLGSPGISLRSSGPMLNIQTIRMPRTTTSVTTTVSVTRPASRSSMPLATSRICNPINKNSVDSNMKVNAVQKPWASIRAVALNRPSLRAPR